MKWTDEEDKALVEYRHKGFIYPRIVHLMAERFGKSCTINSAKNRYSRIIGKEAEWKKSREKKDQDIDKEIKYKASTEILADGSHKSDKLIRMSDEQSKSVNFLLNAHGYDKEVWELVGAKSNIWNTNNKKKGIETLRSSRISVKPKKDSFTIEDVKGIVSDLMKNYKPIIFEPIRYAINGKLLELNVSDLHLNKLGYKDGEYDHEQAEKIFFHVIRDVLSRTEGQSFEKIFFIWSHDFFNIDSLAKTTTAGTPQDTSMRYSSMYKLGKKMLIQGIDLIKQVAPVETVQVGANHDKLSSYTLSEVLHAWYRDDPNVTIDNDPLSRKYRTFGKCLIGFSHGNEEKKRLGKIMPAEARVEWGKTLFSEIHAAHLHSEQAVTEENGVIVRYLSSPSGTDNWHFDSAYVGAIKKTQAFIWDKELGLTDILHTTITPKVLI